jgi:hypothetical protein
LAKCAAGTMQVLGAWSARSFTDRVAKLFVYAILTTYLLYCVQSDGPVFLPTLSTTWVRR